MEFRQSKLPKRRALPKKAITARITVIFINEDVLSVVASVHTSRCSYFFFSFSLFISFSFFFPRCVPVWSSIILIFSRLFFVTFALGTDLNILEKVLPRNPSHDRFLGSLLDFGEKSYLILVTSLFPPLSAQFFVFFTSFSSFLWCWLAIAQFSCRFLRDFVIWIDRLGTGYLYCDQFGVDWFKDHSVWADVTRKCFLQRDLTLRQYLPVLTTGNFH